MADKHPLQVQEKREVEKEQEETRPMRAFLPTVDIYETENALTVVLEMPGVARNNIDVNVDNGVLMIEGKIDFANTRTCSRYIANTISVHFGGVFGFQAGLIRTRSKLRCVTALSRSLYQRQNNPSRVTSR